MHMKVLGLLHLSSISQMKLGCFMAGLPNLGPATLCDLSAMAAAIACIAALVTSATALAIASFTITCSLANPTFDLFNFSLCLPKWYFYY